MIRSLCNRFCSVLVLSGALTACEVSKNTQTPQTNPQYPQQQYPQPFPNAQYPQQQYPQQPYPQQVPQVAPVAQQRPLLAPLLGSAAMQAEVRGVLGELVNALDAGTQARVRGIPLVFDPTLEINAYAGCDDNGAPFLAGTEGLLLAVDAMAQTRATDELFGTQTYEAYAAKVIPELVRSESANPALPAGIIPAQYGGDARRWSRARELFQDVMAFTFGHELGHHYLQHTGCANGARGGSGPSPAAIGRLVTRVLPGLNQFNETASDSVGCENALNAGAARRPRYRWSEKGGLTLLDFFGRLERAAGVNPLSLTGFLRTHPNPLLRMPLVNTVAQNWYARHRDINPASQQ